MMAKDLKKFLNKPNIKNQILIDLKNITNIEINDLNISSICDNKISLDSNFIDNELNILSKSFRELRISIDIENIVLDNKEIWLVKPYFKFINKIGIMYKNEIYSNEDFILMYSYELEKSLLKLKKYNFSNGITRLIFNYDNNKSKQYYYMDLFDILTIRGICRKIKNCISFSIETFNNNIWEKVELNKEDLNNCINELSKNSLSNIKFI